MRNGSRPEYYRVEGALKLTQMRQSEWRRRWGIQGLAVLDIQVSAGADDGYSHSGGAFDSGGGESFIGTSGGLTFDGFFRFDGVTIPAGATITAAYVTVTPSRNNTAAGNVSNLYFSDEDDAAAPTTQAEHAADPRTTAFAAWDAEAMTQDVEEQSPSIVDALQEVIDRGGWSANQALLLLWDDDGSQNGQFHSSRTYDNDTSKALKLHVEYTT